MINTHTIVVILWVGTVQSSSYIIVNITRGWQPLSRLTTGVSISINIWHHCGEPLNSSAGGVDQSHWIYPPTQDSSPQQDYETISGFLGNLRICYGGASSRSKGSPRYHQKWLGQCLGIESWGFGPVSWCSQHHSWWASDLSRGPTYS